MNKLGTVIGFTFWNKVKTKAFVVTTIIFALLVTIGVNVPYLIKLFTGDDGNNETKIGLIYGSQSEIALRLEQFAASQPQAGFKLVKYEQADEKVLAKDIEDKKIDGYLQFKDAPAGQFPQAVYTSKDGNLGMGLQSTLQSGLQIVKTQYITKGSLSDAQVAALNQPVQIDAQQVKGQDGAGTTGNEKQTGANYVFVYIMIVLFWMTTMMTGNMIASEVTSEKSSRIMEILITSASPLTQMFGKIIGMFLIGIVQIVVFGAVLAINVMLPHNRAAFSQFDIDINQLDLSVLLYGLVFYVLGYLLFSTLFAAIGSMVSRTEDLGQAVMPITMISLASFYIGTFSASSPNSLILKVASYIPFTSPVSMLIRVGLGNVAMWEVGLSLLILIVSIFLFGWLSAKIYRTGVLMYGKRPTLKEVRKAMQAYKI
ncbi:ABC transporter permease [Paenibacillus sp. YPG26]|uniref:ABC transporter permease n=1 Tax=Paenibacillus sp. YPG26 TaxID=2878915 RepID=UPI00203F476D|nr:ABC transporter permease [Paenibacillus sp. YPG26]USB33767.1 ABC transporter permease [Paenibacillus sp. YPG26]